MRGIFILLLIIFFNIKAYSQDSITFIKRMYVQIGSTIPIKTINRTRLNFSFNVETEHSLIFGINFYNSEFGEEGYPTTIKKMFGKTRIVNKVSEFNLAVGRIKNFNENLSLSLSAGPSFIQYTKPVNIRETPRNFLFPPSYQFEEKIYNMLGWSLRFDTSVFPLYFLGISIGGTYSYNKRVPTGGINVNILLGRLKEKK